MHEFSIQLIKCSQHKLFLNAHNCTPLRFDWSRFLRNASSFSVMFTSVVSVSLFLFFSWRFMVVLGQVVRLFHKMRQGLPEATPHLHQPGTHQRRRPVPGRKATAARMQQFVPRYCQIYWTCSTWVPNIIPPLCWHFGHVNGWLQVKCMENSFVSKFDDIYTRSNLQIGVS